MCLLTCISGPIYKLTHGKALYFLHTVQLCLHVWKGPGTPDCTPTLHLQLDTMPRPAAASTGAFAIQVNFMQRREGGSERYGRRTNPRDLCKRERETTARSFKLRLFCFQSHRPGPEWS